MAAGKFRTAQFEQITLFKDSPVNRLMYPTNLCFFLLFSLQVKMVNGSI